MSNKKVLVVVCAYNEQDGIFHCLDSLRISIEKHNLKGCFSVVCVDNSSTDETQDIAFKFARENKGFNYVKIEHCNLCISRNTYKSFEGFSYIAYIDGDGYVAEDWAISLVKILNRNSDAHIVSGPVFDLESKTENLVWDMYFDSNLYGVDNYLIGANMVFSRELLDKVDGFPSFFPVRGDESSLLLRISNLGEDINHIFDTSLVAYNYFPSDLSTFLKVQYTDGKRSYDISQLSGTYLKTKLNGVLKLVSLLLLLSAPLIALLSPALAMLSFLVSIGPFLLRHKTYVKNVFGKVRSPSLMRKFKYASTIILSRYLFDVGFLSRFIENKVIKSEMLAETKNPTVVESING
ncbi:glycosyltransferase family 2 protein [Vibrio kyushuensis]|uniref:glycosyltransferase n=1 Tax=Vibrio kyushuensis TaxID=2910249 RepID=UPI003D0C4440